MTDTLNLWTVVETAITDDERGRLAECEAVIERGLKTFVDVGNALLQIRDDRLYRAEYGTFEDYCRLKWGFSKRYANYQIEAAKTISNLGTIVPNNEPVFLNNPATWPAGFKLPETESQARPLTSLPAEIQREAWQRAVETAPEGKITAAHVQSVVDEIQQRPERFTRPENLHVSDDSYEWYTPADIINAARMVMGGIDLDPASSADAQEVVNANAYYTKEVDGLSQSWHGRVWLNPPYCMPDVENFINRVISDYQDGSIEAAIVLINNSTDAAYFHRALANARIVCLTRGRVKYWGPNASQARQGQAIFYFGNRPEVFARVFENFGAVVTLYDHSRPG